MNRLVMRKMGSFGQKNIFSTPLFRRPKHRFCGPRPYISARPSRARKQAVTTNCSIDNDGRGGQADIPLE
jgi:hypothetical protein